MTLLPKEGRMADSKKTCKESSECISQIKRFKVQSTKEHFKWNLPVEMSEYVNSHFQVFLPYKGVHESILSENSVPWNVGKPQVIDDFLTPLITKFKWLQLDSNAQPLSS